MSRPVSDRMAVALDDAVERMLGVMLRWGEDVRGPCNTWTQPIAETVRVLVDARVALADTKEEAAWRATIK